MLQAVVFVTDVIEIAIIFYLPINKSSNNNRFFVCLFDLILYVHSTIFQLCGTVLPGFNQY